MGLTPRRTGRLTVGRKATLTLTRVTVMKQSPNSEYKVSLGFWMIRIVEEIKLLLLYNLLYMYVVGVIEDWDN
jgi:hypothetical protein